MSIVDYRRFRKDPVTPHPPPSLHFLANNRCYSPQSQLFQYKAVQCCENCFLVYAEVASSPAIELSLTSEVPPVPLPSPLMILLA
jgi:hypothetical protein